MCVYLVLFLLYALVAIYGNSVAKKHLGDSILLEFAGIRNPSFLYIQFAPILGSILIIGNFVFWKVNPTGSQHGQHRNRNHQQKLGMEMRMRGNEPIVQQILPEVRKKSVLRIFRLWILGRRTGLAGPAPAEAQIPKKSAFCPKCGAKRPTDIAAPKPAYAADSAYTSESAYAPRSAYTPDSAYAPKPARTPDPAIFP